MTFAGFPAPSFITDNPWSSNYYGPLRKALKRPQTPEEIAAEKAEKAKGPKTLWQRFLDYVRKLPIFVFYKYLWQTNRPLLYRSLLINYFLPMFLELLPWWWTSERKLQIELRTMKIKITHGMQNQKEFPADTVHRYFWSSFWFTILQSILRHLSTRASIENSFMIKKLVMEKLLYSELGYLEDVRAWDLEQQISMDVNQTLSFFNFTLPSLFSSIYSFAREGLEMYSIRERIDPLLILHPLGFDLLRRVANWFKYEYIEKKQGETFLDNSNRMMNFVTNSLAGLSEIQINNLQRAQLAQLDDIIKAEVHNTAGMHSLGTRMWNEFSSRAVLEFVTEVYVVHHIMKKHGMDHEQYRKLQYDIDRVIKLGQQSYSLLRVTKNIFDYQSKVVDLLQIPNWLHELTLTPAQIGTFESLRVAGELSFAYPSSPQPSLFPGSTAQPALRLEEYQQMTFKAGKQYAIIGQNRSGKSTLANLLCKLYAPQCGRLSLNGIPYELIPRVQIRDIISYVSQKPFIFPGTIMENIRIGNANATESQIIAAAHAAGVFTFGMAERPNVSSTPSVATMTGEGSGLHRTTKPLLLTRRMQSIQVDSFSTFLSHSQRVRAHQSADDLYLPPPTDSSPAASSASPTSPSPSPRAAPLHSIVSSPSVHNSAISNVGLPKIAPRMSATAAMAAAMAAASPRRDSLTSLRSPDEQNSSLLLSPSGTVDHILWKSILDQEVTARGANISGGFAQSIALARVFVKESARIIILDEAMGQMDAYKKREVIMPRLMQFVRERNITLITISHDLASVQHVDRIFVLHEGKLVHQGSHEELVAKKASVYMKLLGLPLGDGAATTAESSLPRGKTFG